MNLRKYLIVLDLRSSPGRMSCSAPEQDLVASPDCSIICDDQDFFKLVRWWIVNESLLMMIKCCTFISKTFLLLNIYTFVGFWSNESSKGYFHWKIEGQRKLPIASEASVDILRGLSLYNISESELHHWKFIQFICSVQKYSENWCQYKKLSFVARTFKFPGNIC